MAIFLWQAARDVRLWADVEVHEREGLFGPAAHRVRVPDAPSAIERALRVLAGFVRAPEAAEPGPIGAACATISEWADREGHLTLARAYAEAWASVEPRSAHAAAVAGGLSTRLAEDARAEVWLRRAVRLGRAERDWEWYIRGYLRLGILKFNLGEYRPAKRFQLRAFRMAVWAGHNSLAGKARHDLMAICTDQQQFDLGIDYARDVLRFYAADDPVFPYFLHDAGFLLLQSGRYAHAEALLKAALPHIPEHRRGLILGTMARAAAASGDRRRFDELSRRVLARLAHSDEGAAAAYVRLADGARQFEEWETAERYAARALEIAHRRHEGEPQRLAHQVLDRASVRDASLDVFPLRHDPDDVVRKILSRFERYRTGR